MRSMFNQNEITVTRMTRTGDKTAYAALTTGFAYIKPMTEEQASVNGMQYGLVFNLICDADLALKEADRILSNGVTYTIKGCATHLRGPHRFIKAVLIKTL